MTIPVPHWLESQIDQAVGEGIRERASREGVSLTVAATRELADIRRRNAERRVPPLALLDLAAE